MVWIVSNYLILLALALAEKEKVARKSSTLDHRGDRNADGDAHSRSPIKNKKEKVTHPVFNQLMPDET